VLGSKAGVDPNKIVQVLSGGLANSRVMEMRGPSMIEHNFQPGFRVDLHRKDLGIALATGRETGVPLPMTSLVSQFFDSVSVAGGGDLDHSSVLSLFEQMANHKVTSNA
jgi:2-hydroxy-3-oxopropionate reductase